MWYLKRIRVRQRTTFHQVVLVNRARALAASNEILLLVRSGGANFALPSDSVMAQKESPSASLVNLR
jgi:hypothetical protein